MFPFVSMIKSFGALADQLKEDQLAMGRTIIFCQRLEDYPKIYCFFQSSLGDMFTYPAGSPNTCENRIVDLFHSCIESCIKDKIIEAFASDLSPLQIAIATTAFGMGIDVPNIRTIIHFGSCEDVETYIIFKLLSVMERHQRLSYYLEKMSSMLTNK